MRFFYRLLPLAAAGVRLGWGLLAWLWVASGLVAVLGALPWLELTVPGLWRWATTFAVLATLSGLGAGYFAQRTQSRAWQRALARLTHQSRVLLRRALTAWATVSAVSFLLMFVIGWAALLVIAIPVGFFLQTPAPDQALFTRGNQQLVQRDKELLVLRPLLPGLRLVLSLAPEELDSTWVPTTQPTPPLTYLPADLARTQTLLLASAYQARREAAAERRDQAQQAAALAAQQATEQALGYDIVHFDLADHWYVPGRERAFRALRPPLDSTRYGYAKLSPAGTLHLTCDNLGNDSETLTLAVAHFKGLGSYQLAARPAAGEPSAFTLRRYTQGVGTTFTSPPEAPAHVAITRFDPQQRVVEGTFAGQLASPSGASIALRDGVFKLRFRYLGSLSAPPR